MSKTIRIAHVALQLETGGMERLLVEFARHADRRRFDVQFVALESAGGVAADIESAGCRVTALDSRRGVRPSLIFGLARFFRDQQIDIVHTHNTRPLVYAGPSARLAQVRGIVHTRHGQRHGATPKQNLLFRLAGRCADRMVCVSEDSARRCRGEGVDPACIRVIWNGIDRKRFTFTGPSAAGPALYVGRLSPEKDVATLLRAVKLVVAGHPLFRLRIAGAGACWAGLKSVADDFGLQENVEFLGNVPDVRGLLAGASLLVLPSVTEGLPLTVLEAMASGLPVVATRVGGTPEAVAEGETGLLVEPRDPEQLAQAIRRLWCDADLGRSMGLAGHRRVEELFDVCRMVTRYESLYEEVLHGAVALAA